MTRDATASKTGSKPLPERRNLTLAELAADQGIHDPQDFSALCGAGADLWDDDAQFEIFLTALRESRRTGD